MKPALETDSSSAAATKTPASTSAALDYHTPLSRWQRWRLALTGGAVVVSSHLLALLASFILLLVLPLVVYVLAYVILFLVAASTKADMGGLLTLPAGCLFILLVGAAAIFTTCLANVLTDTVRRALRWPFWTPPVGVLVLAAIATASGNLLSRHPLWPSCRDAALATAALTALFCVYWVPLSFAEATLRLLRWVAGKTWKRMRATPAIPAGKSEPEKTA